MKAYLNCGAECSGNPRGVPMRALRISALAWEAGAGRHHIICTWERSGPGRANLYNQDTGSQQAHTVTGVSSSTPREALSTRSQTERAWDHEYRYLQISFPMLYSPTNRRKESPNSRRLNQICRIHRQRIAV